jgi:hypothetical protein
LITLSGTKSPGLVKTAQLTQHSLEYNPTIGEDCSGLYYGWYICIGVQPLTSVSLDWYTSQATNVSIPSATAFVPPPATFVQNFTAQPQQTGIPSSCQNFYQAESVSQIPPLRALCSVLREQQDDNCNTVLGIYNYISKEQFFAWNPALNGNCNGLLLGYYYCVANFDAASPPLPPTVTASPSPTATGTTKDCTAWYLAVGNDNCASIALAFGTFSETGKQHNLAPLFHPAFEAKILPDFKSWNPNVYSDCSNIRENTYYCVAVPGTPSTRTAPLPSTPTGSMPTQTGITADCTKFWLVSQDDTCASITAAAGISSADFLAWNPALGTNCAGLKADYYVCVSTKPVETPTSTVTLPGNGAIPSTTTTRTTASSSSSSSAGTTTTSAPSQPVTTPSPYMPGMVAGCVRFWFRGPDAADMYCYDIAAAAGVPLE